LRDHNIHKYKGVRRTFFHQLYSIDLYRYAIAKIRFVWYARILRRIRTHKLTDEGVAGNTISHNLKGLKDLAVTRSLAIVKPFAVIESLGKDSRILSLGPRTEGEIFNLIAQGFERKNISALDLISYSPWIDIGDMHNMPYEDSTFDGVVMGWMLGYSVKPEAAAMEVVRVTKPGGIIAIGEEYGGEEAKEAIKKMGYTPGAGRVRTHPKDILQYFGDYVDAIYFQHFITPERIKTKGSIIAIFSIKK